MLSNTFIIVSKLISTINNSASSFNFNLFLSVCFHLLLLLVGELQDVYYPRVPYTDVDYLVFSDAASLVLEGRSPYERATFRYSPLMAWICIPNIIFFKCFGKILFCLADICVGYELYTILILRGEPKTRASMFSALFLLSPLSVNVSTRGSSDSIICFLVLRVLRLLLEKKDSMAAILFGLSVHLRIFPIIYAFPIILSLQSTSTSFTKLTSSSLSSSSSSSTTTIATTSSSSTTTTTTTFYQKNEDNDKVNKTIDSSFFSNPNLPFTYLFSWRRLQFGFISASVFFFLGFFFYKLYGIQFLNETYLYHISRNDIRHNFSVSFYGQYLMSASKSSISNHHSFFNSLLSLVPFLGTSISLGGFLYTDLPLCFFSQTLSFVAFNKVITAQYFNWWLSLLPIVAAKSRITLLGPAILLIAMWIATELHWLFWAFHLEIQSKSSFFGVWVASLFFLIANTIVLCSILLSQR
jgi:GPI mannosyltransferase 1 subunit M